MIASILYIYFPELPDAYTQLNHNFHTSDPNIRAPCIYLTIYLYIYFLELPNTLTQLNHNFRKSDPNISAPRTYQMTIQKLTKY